MTSSIQDSRPAADVRRRGAVYGIPCWAVDEHGMPIVGRVVVGYVGKSRQTVKQREGQHRESQPFSDLIVGGSFVIEEGWWTDAELDAREQFYIRHGVVLAPGMASQRPVYNYEHNLDNPDRIEIWRARQHRQAREPGWQPVANGARVPRQRATVRQEAGSSSLARWWVRRRWWVVGFGVLWSALFVAALRGLWLWRDDLMLSAAAGAASAPFAAVWGSMLYLRVRGWWRYHTRPRRRRRSGRRR